MKRDGMGQDRQSRCDNAAPETYSGPKTSKPLNNVNHDMTGILAWLTI